MKKINLKGKKIRLFFHTDMDGTVSASLIQLFSGAKIVKYVPCPFQNYPKPEKLSADVLDVFVDCRSREKNEDIRIDHHAGGEDKEYLDREGIVVDSKYKSAVSLVAHYLNIKVNKQILKEMDEKDSGHKNVFWYFKEDNHTIHKMLVSPGMKKSDYLNYETFKDKALGFMEKGFAIEDLKDTPKGYEQKLERKFKVVVEEIKKPGKPLIKLIHTPTKKGIFFNNAFKMTDSEYYHHVFAYVNQHYVPESEKNNVGIYVVCGFRARNFEFDEKLHKVVKDDHPEPYQLFIKRTSKNTTIHIGDLIQKAKERTGITNGGGGAEIGGINTGDSEKAIAALKFITDEIRNNCP